MRILCAAARCLPERLLRLARHAVPPPGSAPTPSCPTRSATPTRRSRGTYGVPRIRADLAEAGHHVSRKRVARLMRRDHLAGVHRRRFVRTTIRDEDAEPFPDLVNRDFTRHGSRPALGRRHHPAADARRAPATSPRSSTPGAAGSSAGAWPPTCGPSSSPRPSTRRSSAAVRRRGLVHHSDHGSQYTSLAFGQRLRESGIAASMGSVGDCYDNAMAESFFATLETELIDRSRLGEPRRGEGRGVRVHRGLLQPDPPPQQPRQPQSRAVRGALSFESGRRGRVTHHRPRNRGNSNITARARGPRQRGRGAGRASGLRLPRGCDRSPTGSRGRGAASTRVPDVPHRGAGPRGHRAS